MAYNRHMHESIMREYEIRYTTDFYDGVKSFYCEAPTSDEAMRIFAHKCDDSPVRSIKAVLVNTHLLTPSHVKHLAQKHCRSILRDDVVDECDGGGCAGGDAGGACAGGDCGAACCDAGDAAGEMAGTSTVDVLGKNEPGEGYLGKDNFYIPHRVPFPVHRYGREIWGTGSTAKGKRKKKQKNPYTTGMSTVVSMFEDEHGSLDLKHEALDEAMSRLEEQIDQLRRQMKKIKHSM